MHSIALLVCLIGIAGLFFLDRDNSVRNSKALWLPVSWLWIVGSRPVSSWLGITPSNQDFNQQLLDGSPTDRAVFSVLLAAGIIVLCWRRKRTRACLRGNVPILIFFSYCLLSVLWSDFPDVAFKRWTKAIGDLVMVLIVVTDAEPVAALRRLFSRVSFVLLPASVFLIKFSELGRGFDPDGNPMNTGVTTNKNTLGVITFVLALGAVWRVLVLLRARDQPNRGRHMLAQVTVVAFGVALLMMANSVTSRVCFALGAVLMLVTGLPVIRRTPSYVHVVVLTIALIGGTAMVFGKAALTHAVGRQENFTGRTEVWAAVLPVVPNAVVGAGFETFWLGPRLQKVWSRLSGFMQVNEAHNGYIEVYLNLGWVGIGLMGNILISGYRRVCKAVHREPMVGSLVLSYVAATATYSVTEAGFRMLNPSWIFLLLAIVGANVTALLGRRPSAAHANRAAEMAASPAFAFTSSVWPSVGEPDGRDLGCSVGLISISPGAFPEASQSDDK